MENFTPVLGLIGGGLIGLGAAVYLLLNGRIAGISGIVGGLLSPRASDIGLRLAFIVGLLVGPFLVGAMGVPLTAIQVTDSWPVLIVGGFLVGFGTRLGSGCTSGHGVCGLARLSPRSLAATGIFMAAGIVVAVLARHVFGG